MADLFQTPADLARYVYLITDDGGRSGTRYTMIFTDGTYLEMSGSPDHPKGVCRRGHQMASWVFTKIHNEVLDNKVVSLALGDLPKNVIAYVQEFQNRSYEGFLSSVMEKDTSVVGADRKEATLHKGTPDSLGEGIYVENGKYKIKCGHQDDLGPFDTAREVILASIPSGWAYDKKTVENSYRRGITRLEPDDSVRAAVKKLETRYDKAWEKEVKLGPPSTRY